MYIYIYIDAAEPACKGSRRGSDRYLITQVQQTSTQYHTYDRCRRFCPTNIASIGNSNQRPRADRELSGASTSRSLPTWFGPTQNWPPALARRDFPF